jgi:hypothetical protein
MKRWDTDRDGDEYETETGPFVHFTDVAQLERDYEAARIINVRLQGEMEAATTKARTYLDLVKERNQTICGLNDDNIRLQVEVDRLKRREHVDAQHEETGRYWAGPRGRIPPRFFETPESSVSAQRAPQPEIGWQPIETAPKDGTSIIAWCVHRNAPYAKDPVAEGWEGPVITSWTAFNEGGWVWHGLCGTFSHWMPCPCRPQS